MWQNEGLPRDVSRSKAAKTDKELLLRRNLHYGCNPHHASLLQEKGHAHLVPISPLARVPSSSSSLQSAPQTTLPTFPLFSLLPFPHKFFVAGAKVQFAHQIKSPPNGVSGESEGDAEWKEKSRKKGFIIKSNF